MVLYLPLKLVHVTGFASINQVDFTGSWSIIMGDVSLITLFYYIFHVFHWSSGTHQKSGIGYTLAWYPMFLLSLPLMFSVDSESKGKFM